MSAVPRARLTYAKLAWTLGGLTLVLSCVLVLAVMVGEEPLSLWRALEQPASLDGVLLRSLRLPRALLAAMVGAALSASGAALQGLTRNPLADPFVLGVSGGAALGASLALVMGLGSLDSGTAAQWPLVHWFSAPSLFAFAGALGATLLVFGVAGTQTYAALLTGVVFNAFALAAITFLRALSAPERMTELVYWLSGTIGHERPSTLVGLGALELLALLGLWRLSGALNLLSLGDAQAASLGVRVGRAKLGVLLFASLAVSGAVALTGLIGFVGLLVPHLFRLVVGGDARLLVPASALGGAAFLCLADAGARVLFRVFGAEPPVGVLTALIGGPTFLLLLRQRVGSRGGLESNAPV